MSAQGFRRLVALAAMAGCLVIASEAPAQYTWKSATSSNWNNAANWTGGIPVSGATTTLTFGDGTYTATNDLPATPFQLTALTFGASGTATISDSGQGLNFVGAAPTITMGAGNAIINSAITLGATTTIGGGAGTLTLNGMISDGGNGFFLTMNSAGTLAMTGGGSITQLLLNSGTTNITGGTLAVTQTDPSGLRPPGIGMGEVVGTSSLNISGGAQVNVTENVFIGDVAGSTATMTVSGAGTNINNTIGGLAGRFAVGNFGSGTLNIVNGGSVTALFLFTPREPVTAGFPVNTGTINVSGPGSTLTVTTEASFCSNGLGIATFSNGATLNGAGTGDMLLGVNPTGYGSVTFTDPGTTANITELLVAYGTGAVNCTVNILNGATFTATQGVFIGNGGLSSGTVNVSGVGSALLAPGVDPSLAQNLTVGQAGVGILNISAGGTAKAGLFFMGDIVGSAGTVNLNGLNSSLIVSSQSMIGGDFDATGAPVPGGTGVINANDGTIVNLGKTYLYGGGTLNVNTGYFGSFTVVGLNDGAPGASVGTVSVGSGSTLTIATNGNNAAFSGVISGAGGITKTGLGTQTLTGTNTFTGPVEIDGGVLNFTTQANLGAGTAITFNGGTLQYAAGNTSDISALTVTVNGRGATIDTGSNTVTFANTIGSNNPQNDPSLFYPPAPGYGSGALTKLGTGTLVLAPAPLAALPAGTPAFNNYVGGTNIQNGTLSVASDLFLGAVNNGTVTAPILVAQGNVTGAAAGTLLFTGTTSTGRNYAMNGGTIAVAATQTVTFVGSQVSGAFLDGSGTFATDPTAGAQFISTTSQPSVSITSNSANDQYVHFTNQGPFTVPAGVGSHTPGTTPVGVSLNGFTNAGSGVMTIGAGSYVNAVNFQSSGKLTINAGADTSHISLLYNNGATTLNFNGGSRTFVGTPLAGGAISNAGIDLHGSNAIVAGGLLVNNGYVVDSGAAGSAAVIADFGSLVKGAGFFQNSVQTINGGKFQPGNSPGSASFGSFVMGTGGVNNYVFAIDDATGSAGPSPDSNGLVSGWGLVKAVKQAVGSLVTSGNFTFGASPISKVTVSLDTLVNPTAVGVDIPGTMADFDPTRPYSWTAATWSGVYSGPTNVAALDAATSFDTSGFLNPVAGSFGWGLDLGGHSLSLTYTPTAVPEPGTLSLLCATAAAAGVWRRRRVATTVATR